LDEAAQITTPSEAPAQAVEDQEIPDWELGTATEGALVSVLVVTSIPPGARVIFDGEPIEERTPLTLPTVAVGPHELAIRKSGFRSWHRRVQVGGEGATTVEARLQRARVAERGTLSINTRPWSKVYVGGRLVGTTPIGRAAVPAGSVRLRLVDRDGETHHRTVRVTPDEDKRVFFDLSGD